MVSTRFINSQRAVHVRYFRQLGVLVRRIGVRLNALQILRLYRYRNGYTHDVLAVVVRSVCKAVGSKELARGRRRDRVNSVLNLPDRRVGRIVCRIEVRIRHVHADIADIFRLLLGYINRHSLCAAALDGFLFAVRFFRAVHGIVRTVIKDNRILGLCSGGDIFRNLRFIHRDDLCLIRFVRQCDRREHTRCNRCGKEQ